MLAIHKASLSIIEDKVTVFDRATLSSTIDARKRHDVVELKSDKLQILVELFRRYLMQNLKN